MKIENRRLKDEIEQEKHKLKREIINEREKAQDELAEIRKIQHKIELEIPDKQVKAEAIKQELAGNLVITEEQYVKLKSLREERLSIKDYVLTRVHEETLRYMQDNDRTRKELKGTKEKLDIITDQFDNVKMELEHLKKKYNNSATGYIKKINDFENRDKDLQTEFTKMDSQLIELKEKAKKYDEVLEQLNDVLGKQKLMQADLLKQKSEIEKQENEINERKTEIMKLKQKIDILDNDKTYLQKESALISGKNKALEDCNDQLVKELQNYKKDNIECSDKMLKTQDDIISKYEAKHREQISELKRNHEYELESTKSTIMDIYEKRILYLTSSKDEIEHKLEETQKELKKKMEEYEKLLFDYKESKRGLQEECASLRLQLRFKTDEATRLSSMYEEQINGYKEAQIEAQVSNDKLELLRSECYRLESALNQTQITAKAENSLLKERLKNYEKIEDELGEVLLKAAEGEIPELSKELAYTITHGATSSKRQIKQSLSLSNQLIARQKELNEVNNKLAKVEEECRKQTMDADKYKRILSKSNHPISYLTMSIESIEKELETSIKENKRKNEIIENMQSEMKTLKMVS